MNFVFPVVTSCSLVDITRFSDEPAGSIFGQKYNLKTEAACFSYNSQIPEGKP
jgi:hypothetical protein